MRAGQEEPSGRNRRRVLPIRYTEPALTYFRLTPVISTRKGEKHVSQGSRRAADGFTLLELMLVISIIAILAGMSLPALKGISKSNSMTAATRQLLDDVASARQKALSEHTAVYMVFINGGVIDTNSARFPGVPQLPQTTINAVNLLLNAQLRAYALIATHSVGDQPGQESPRYLTQWKKLPDGVYIPLEKFSTGLKVTETNQVTGFVNSTTINRFTYTNIFPFPYVNSGVNFMLPFIKFNAQGQCVYWNAKDQRDEARDDGEYIPLTRGSVFYTTNQPLSVVETPRGESTNNYNLIHIDAMTGRGKLLRKEIK